MAKIPNFCSVFTTNLYESTETKFKIGIRVRISKFDLPFRKGYIQQCIRENFEIVLIATGKPPKYTKKLIRMRLYVANNVKKI